MGFDSQHAKTLRETGFWGKAGAGCVPFARKTGRFLMVLRSRHVEQPNTWGTFGGAIDPDGETNPAKHAERELREESEYSGPVNKMVPLVVFQKDSFRYYNFLAVVPDEFQPVLNWESSKAKWVDFGNWPSPLHFGLKFLLDDNDSINTMRQYVNKG